MPDQPRAVDVLFVDEPAGVGPALDTLDAEVVGIDVERADADRYFRRAALVQVGVADRCVLLDGVTIETMPELDAFLGPGRTAVFHALENDLEPLAAKDVTAERMEDTAIAAAMLGLPTGLGSLQDQILGVDVDGRKSAFQRADWEERPLLEDMVAYAAGDVIHLPQLWAALAERLEDSGRTAWYREELAWTAQRASEETRAWTRVKGSGRLTPEQRSVLRAVWDERERLAREHDLAPNRLVHDDVLRDIAVDPPRTAAQLVRRSQRRRALLRQHSDALLAAVQAGLDADAEPREDSGRRWSDRDRAVFDALRKARSKVARSIGMDPGVLCPSRPLWSAIAGEPEDAEALCKLVELRGWQTELLAEPLWEAYTRASSKCSASGSAEVPLEDA